MEKFPSIEGENTNEDEVLGLSPEDYSDELDSKEELVDKLIRGLEEERTEADAKSARTGQLEDVQEQIAKMKYKAQESGGMLDLVERMDDMLARIREALKKVTH